MCLTLLGSTGRICKFIHLLQTHIEPRDFAGWGGYPGKKQRDGGNLVRMHAAVEGGDVLGVMQTPEVAMGLNSKRDPIVIREVGGDDRFLHVAMPIV